MIENNSGIRDCIFTIYDCAYALQIEGTQKEISPEYCKAKIDIIEHDLKCLKGRLGVE